MIDQLRRLFKKETERDETKKLRQEAREARERIHAKLNGGTSELARAMLKEMAERG
ncbi:MAG: hypothetical protein ACPGVG_17435 [Mycobacterium sp.]